MGKQTKYIFVTGGVLSGVGKGITAASIGKALAEDTLIRAAYTYEQSQQFHNKIAGLGGENA